ncbi:MAG TPA: metal-dependent transcriptional regulator [Lachnospiraceae bacterium]|nr:metal-dependent transcriptional regulator [Lachnospiraceae bacterium]
MSLSGNNVTASLEDYLEAIYFLYQKKSEVRITDVARELDISKPSVNRAINTLKKQGLVEHEYYGDLKLTEKGLKIACDVAERHKILKAFLTEKLGVNDETAEREACLIEHNISDDTMDRLRLFMK